MKNLRQKIAGVGLGATLVLGGAAGAYALTGNASAQESTSTTVAAAPNGTQAPTGQAPTGQPPAGNFDPSKGGHVGQNGTKETLLTGEAATKATAAATAAVPGGTIERVENDAEGATYEAHVVKADGSHVTVKMDASYKVTGIEDGPGAPRGHR